MCPLQIGTYCVHRSHAERQAPVPDVSRRSDARQGLLYDQSSSSHAVASCAATDAAVTWTLALTQCTPLSKDACWHSSCLACIACAYSCHSFNAASGLAGQLRSTAFRACERVDRYHFMALCNMPQCSGLVQHHLYGDWQDCAHVQTERPSHVKHRHDWCWCCRKACLLVSRGPV